MCSRRNKIRDRQKYFTYCFIPFHRVLRQVKRMAGRGEIHNSKMCRVFVAEFPSCCQPVLKTSTGPHRFFSLQQTLLHQLSDFNTNSKLQLYLNIFVLLLPAGDVGQITVRKYTASDSSAAGCFTAPSELVAFALFAALQFFTRYLPTYLQQLCGTRFRHWYNYKVTHIHFPGLMAPCGLRELCFFARIGLIRFLARCHKRRLNQG